MRKSDASSFGVKSVLWSTVRRHPLLTAALLCAVTGSVLLALLPPKLLGRMVDGLSTGEGISLVMALLYFALLALSGLTDAGKEVLITLFGQKITHALRSQMAQKVTRLPANYFNGHESGEITSRIINDVDAVESLFTNGMISMLADACKVVGIMVILFSQSVGLGLLILGLLPLLFGMTRRFQRSMLKAQLEHRLAIGKVNACIPETLRILRTIQSYGKFDFMERRYDAAIGQSYRAMEKSNLCDSIYSPIIHLVSALMVATALTLSALGGAMQGFFGLTVGSAVAVIAYVGQVFGPIESIGMEIQNVQSAWAGVKRIGAFFDEPERPCAEDTCLPVDSDAPCVELQQVSFGYEPSKQVLDGLSLCIRRGEKITLVGRTGAGKSTVFRLLLGLYSPWQGQVRVWGVQAEHIPDRAKRQLFGYVEQSFHSVAGTVLEQITLFDPAVTRQQAQAAAQLVGLEATILSLPEGYDTLFEHAAFSQGQLQLLSIARAVAGNPRVMLLDEITANLDSMTESRVLAALEAVSKGRTLISISHRLYGQLDSKLVRIDG